MRSYISVFVVILASQFVYISAANAATYSWATGNGVSTFIGSSPSEACQKLVDAERIRWGYASTTMDLFKQSDTMFGCNYSYTNTGGGSGDRGRPYAYSVNRSGDSCLTAADTYDPATGTCSAPASPPGLACVGSGESLSAFGFITNSEGQCVDYTRADLASQCKNLGGTSIPHTLYVSFDGDGNPLAPPPITAGGCAAVAAGVSHCTMAPKRVYPTGGSIQPTGNNCKVLVSFTGDTAASGDKLPVVTGPGADGLCQGDCEDLPPAPTGNQSTPCTYVEDGEGRRVCASNQYNYQPGQTSCGSVNGQFQCVGKAPTTNGVTISTTVKDTLNPDGSKTSVKTDNATAISCTGNAKCIAQSTTTTTTTTYNSNGAKTGQSTSCTGASCPPSGDGKGNCEPGKECASEDDSGFEGSELGDAPGFGETLEAFMSDVKGAPLIAGVSSITVPTGGSCSFQPMVVPILGTLSFQPMCTWAADWFAPLRFLMLAIWAIVAVRTFMEA